jgi:hypothetical protein
MQTTMDEAKNNGDKATIKTTNNNQTNDNKQTNKQTTHEAALSEDSNLACME